MMPGHALEGPAVGRSDPLAAPLRVGPLTYRNRVVVSPMSVEYALRDGRAGARLQEYMRRRAQGGAALVMTGFAFVDEATGRGSDRQVGASAERHLPGLTRLALAIHREGALFGVQLVHAGRNSVVPDRLPGGLLGPSALAAADGMTVPRAMRLAEIRALPEQFAAAAGRASRAGADVVEIHAAHGYLLNEFLSGAANRRTDAYGGPLRNRARLLLEVVAAVRRACPDRALGVRLGADDGVPEGMNAQAAAEVAQWCEAAGVDYVSVSAGGEPPGWRSGSIRAYQDPGYLLPLAAAVRAAVSVPVAAVGSLGYPAPARQALERGACDLVVVGRGHLADPDWAVKALGGPGAIRPCIRANVCRQDYSDGRGARCAVNALLGREAEAGRPHRSLSRAAIVGAGARGLALALHLAEAGTQVTILEANDEVGGELASAAALPHKWEMRELLSYYRSEYRRLGVDVRMGQDPDRTVEQLALLRPEAVVWAVPGNNHAARQVAAASGDGRLPQGGQVRQPGGSNAVADVDRGGAGRPDHWRDDVSSAIRRWQRGDLPPRTVPVRVVGSTQAAADVAGHLALLGYAVALQAADGQTGIASNATAVTRRFLLEWLTEAGVAYSRAEAAPHAAEAEQGSDAAGRPAVWLITEAPPGRGNRSRPAVREWAWNAGVRWLDASRAGAHVLPGTVHAATDAAWRAARSLLRA